MAGAFSEVPFSAESSTGAIQPLFITSTTTFFTFTFIVSSAPEQPDNGGLTDDELLDLWKSVTDPGYHQPILEKPDGGGDEVKAMLAIARETTRVVDASTQSLYILPWSGQTGEPSHTARVATGILQISRVPTSLFPAWVPVVWLGGQFIVDHVGIEWSDEGALEVSTGRRYMLSASISSLGPGDLGPYLYPARAEKAGASYNRPGPDTIRQPIQAGAGLTNVALSTSAPFPNANWLTLAPAPDLLSDAQAGQYVRLSAPAAVAGQVRRVISYQPPNDSSTGGVATLDTVGVFKFGSLVGAFQSGEEVFQASTGARGYLVSLANGHFALEQFLGAPFVAAAVVGSFSGATATITEVVRSCALPVAANVTWTVLDWELDVGLIVTNPEPFSGGRLPVLEELGAERNVFIASNEPEEIYRKRVASAADVVSPNALLRQTNRILSPYGGRGCLREVGYAKLPGLFFDADPDGNPAHAFAFDLDPVVRPGDTWKVLLDFTESRAFFLMGVPLLGLGDYSLYMDEGYFDSTTEYLDGYAVTDAALHSAVYSSLVRAKAGGVGFDLYVESGDCV